MLNLVYRLKKYWYLLVLSVLATLLLTLKITTGPTPNVSDIAKPTPTIFGTVTPFYQSINTNGIKTWNNLFPNQDTEQSLIDRFGQPITRSEESGYQILRYLGQKDKWDTHIYVSKISKLIEMVKVYFPDENYLNIKKTYGKPLYTYYNDDQGAGFKFFVYPQNGFAVSAEESEGIILEIWYFQPTAIESFIQQWGKDLSTTPTEMIIF